MLKSPAIDFNMVDFPLPDSPTSAMVSPFFISISISLTVIFLSENLLSI